MARQATIGWIDVDAVKNAGHDSLGRALSHIGAEPFAAAAKNGAERDPASDGRFRPIGRGSGALAHDRSRAEWMAVQRLLGRLQNDA